METKWVLLRRTNGALRRLGFFPFTLFYALISAAKRVVQLRQSQTVLRVGEATGETTSLPLSVMLWLDRIAPGVPESRFDICLRIERDAGHANLHVAFSVLLTSPRLRSVGMYWDSSSLAADLPLLQARQGRNGPPASATSHEELAALSFTQLHDLFQADHVGITLPIAAIRDARTLLKRQAGGAYAVCLNMPAEYRSLIATFETTHPDVRFFDLTTPLRATKLGNSQSLYGYGLNLHERMALVQMADAYVGSFDELGCAALVSKRPTVLLGGGTGEQPDRISRDDVAVWFPGPMESTTLAEAVLQFLSRQIGPAEN